VDLETEARRDDVALRTFEAMAPVYDDFTAHYDDEGWLADLLKILERHGLNGRRLLDVACGTGKSFLSLLPHGWEVTGCDISPAMVALAEKKGGAVAELCVADMRELPQLGEFDLVWALDDAINYLLSTDELVASLRGMRANLGEDGLLLFDVNELPAYRTFYTARTVIERNGMRFVWEGLSQSGLPASSLFESCLKVEDIEGEKAGRVEASIHRQRHFSESEIVAALADAGLECLDIFGQGLDGIPRQPLDVERHTKAIYIARQASGTCGPNMRPKIPRQ
jgi:SAM-dependent methyltransferase